MYKFGNSLNSSFKTQFSNGSGHGIGHQRNVAHSRIDDEDTIFKKFELGRKLGQVRYLLKQIYENFI